MVRETGAVIGMLMLVAGSAAAQEAQSQTPAPVQTQRPETQDARPESSQVKAVQATAAVDGRRAQTPDAMRNQARNFSVALQRAVLSGAQVMVKKAREVEPNAGAAFSGPTEVLFYRNPQSGPVFDVRVPMMRTNTVWALAILMNMPQGSSRVRQVPPPGQPTPGVVRSAALLPGGSAPTPASPAPTSSPFIDSVLSDPGAVYTREVRSALIDAMIENSFALQVASSDWLTVVAHDDAVPDPSVSGSQTDVPTVVFQIKGSDLTDFVEKRISLEEARKRVKVSED